VPSHSSDCFPISTQRYRTSSSSGKRVVLAYRSSSRRRRHRRDALAQSQTSEPEASRWRCSGSGLLGDSLEPLCRFTCKVSHSARTVDRLSPQRPVRFRLQGQARHSAPQEVTLRRTAPSAVKNGSSSTRWTGGHDVRLWPPASTSFDDRQLSDELGRKRLTPFDCVDHAGEPSAGSSAATTVNRRPPTDFVSGIFLSLPTLRMSIHPRTVAANDTMAAAA
jgi:hypothetical protein